MNSTILYNHNLNICSET